MFMESYISGLLHLWKFTFETLNLHGRESTLEKIVPQGLMRKTEYEVFMIQKIEFIAFIYILLSKI